MRLILAVLFSLSVLSCSSNDTKTPTPDAQVKVEASVQAEASSPHEASVAAEASATDSAVKAQ